MSKSEPQVEVAVWKAGDPYLRKVVSRFPATIGRGADTDVRLDSPHVSRVHAHLHCDGDTIRLVDAGSTNGFTLCGERLRDARLEPDDRVGLCDFVLRVRPLPPEPLAPELSQGWAELFDGDEGTAVRKRVELPESDLTLAADNLSGGLERGLDPEDAAAPEEDDPAEAQPPDLPPLLATLHEEANALLYGDPFGEVAVEVIQAVGDRVYNVALLRAGDTYWWGGSPRGLSAWLPYARADRFPLVTAMGRGLYRVQAPNNPLWKIFHRGEGDLELHRSGLLVGAQVEPADQIEITFGPFTNYVRCVRMPPRARGGGRRVDARLAAALVLSLALHAASAWLPVRPFPPLTAREAAPVDSFVESVPLTYLPLLPPPAPAPRVKAPLREKSEARGGRDDKPRQEPPSASPAVEPHEEPPAAPPAAPTLSVADFKITGFIGELPSLGLGMDVKPMLRGGPTLLRGDAQPSGMVLKGGGTVRPRGRLSDLVVSRVINAHAAEIERCYHRSLDDVPDLAGRMETEWVVDKTGLVRTVRVTYDDIGSPALTRCVRAAITSWVFPPPTGGPASVAYPFVFSNLRR